MKILFIAPNYLPHIGGVEKHIYKLTQELLKDNHQVTILTQKFDNSYKDYEKENNLEIIRVNKKENKILNRLHKAIYMLKFLKSIVKFDIIHVHDYSTFEIFIFPIYPILKLLNKKIYITFHGYEGDVPPRKSIIKRRKLVENLTYKNICIGNFIPKWYGTKADIISYGGVDKVDDIQNLKEDYILFIGRLANDTGIFDYIKAWGSVHQKYDKIQFIICGDGVLKEELKNHIIQNNIKNIIFKGFVSDVESYIKDAKVIFTAGYLGILEAFSYKKNTIAIYDNELKKDYLTMIPNYSEMMWVSDSKLENIIFSLEDALKNTTKKEIAYKYACKNSWEKVKEKYCRLWGR